MHFCTIFFFFSSRELFPSINEEEKSNETIDSSIIITDNEQGTNNKYSNHGDGNKFHIDKLMQNLNKKQRRILNREYERQGNNCCLLITMHCIFCYSLINT